MDALESGGDAAAEPHGQPGPGEESCDSARGAPDASALPGKLQAAQIVSTKAEAETQHALTTSPTGSGGCVSDGGSDARQSAPIICVRTDCDIICSTVSLPSKNSTGAPSAAAVRHYGVAQPSARRLSLSGDAARRLPSPFQARALASECGSGRHGSDRRSSHRSNSSTDPGSADIPDGARSSSEDSLGDAADTNTAVKVYSCSSRGDATWAADAPPCPTRAEQGHSPRPRGPAAPERTSLSYLRPEGGQVEAARLWFGALRSRSNPSPGGGGIEVGAKPCYIRTFSLPSPRFPPSLAPCTSTRHPALTPAPATPHRHAPRQSSPLALVSHASPPLLAAPPAEQKQNQKQKQPAPAEPKGSTPEPAPPPAPHPALRIAARFSAAARFAAANARDPTPHSHPPVRSSPLALYANSRPPSPPPAAPWPPLTRSLRFAYSLPPSPSPSFSATPGASLPPPPFRRSASAPTPSSPRYFSVAPPPRPTGGGGRPSHPPWRPQKLGRCPPSAPPFSLPVPSALESGRWQKIPRGWPADISGHGHGLRRPEVAAEQPKPRGCPTDISGTPRLPEIAARQPENEMSDPEPEPRPPPPPPSTPCPVLFSPCSQTAGGAPFSFRVGQGYAATKHTSGGGPKQNAPPFTPRLFRSSSEPIRPPPHCARPALVLSAVGYERGGLASSKYERGGHTFGRFEWEGRMLAPMAEYRRGGWLTPTLTAVAEVPGIKGSRAPAPPVGMRSHGEREREFPPYIPQALPKLSAPAAAPIPAMLPTPLWPAPHLPTAPAARRQLPAPRGEPSPNHPLSELTACEQGMEPCEQGTTACEQGRPAQQSAAPPLPLPPAPHTLAWLESSGTEARPPHAIAMAAPRTCATLPPSPTPETSPESTAAGRPSSLAEEAASRVSVLMSGRMARLHARQAVNRV